MGVDKMTDTQAIQDYFNSFGIDAYPTTNVPDNATFPFLTYESMITNRGKDVFPMIRLWYHTESEAEPNAMARKIANDIGEGKSLICDNGNICIYFTGQWTPEVQENDTSIKCRYTTLKVTYNTI